MLTSSVKSGSNSFKLPSEGERFRLQARDTKKVIYSRAEGEPLVGDYSGPEYDDQVFTLIYGKDDRKGFYAIKSWYCGKVLFSRTASAPYVGNIYGNAIYDDK